MASSVASTFRDKNLSWDWNNPLQSYEIITQFQVGIFHSALKDDSKIQFLKGFGLGCFYLVTNLTQQISLIAEQVIKAIGQLLGSLDPSSDLSALKGLSFLLRASGNTLGLISILEILISSLILIPIETVMRPGQVIEFYLENQTHPVYSTHWETYEPSAVY